MTQRTMIEIMLERYGIAANVNGAEVRAVIQPMQYRAGAVLNLPTEYYDSLHYLYTGPAGEKLQIGDEVDTVQRNYTVKRSDVFTVDGEEVYVWAVLKALAPDADSEVYLEAEGKKAALIDSYTATALQNSRPVCAWGEQEPAGIAAGAVHYELMLKNVCPLEGIDLYALADFSLVILRPGVKVTYSGCRWKKISGSGGKGSKLCQTAELIAAKREEQKEVVSDG